MDIRDLNRLTCYIMELVLRKKPPRVREHSGGKSNLMRERFDLTDNYHI